MTCLECGRPPRVRGLCRACYQRHWRAGNLAGLPRANYARAELLAEHAHLAADGVSRPEVARRLGMTDGGLYQALRRARCA